MATMRLVGDAENVIYFINWHDVPVLDGCETDRSFNQNLQCLY